MEHNHSAESKNGLIRSIILNSFIVVAEFLGGIFSGSLALLSDAIHNLSDVVSLILSYIGDIISRKNGDSSHTFAFKRAEVIVAFVNSLALLFVGLYIIYEAIHRFFDKQLVINSSLMLWVGLIGLIGNFVSILFLHKEKDDNLNKKSAYLHLLFDTISSVVVVVGGILIYYTHWYAIDLVASIVISLFVLKSGRSILKKSLHILMQGVPENIVLSDIANMIKKQKGVEKIHDLHVWNIDTNDIFLSVHVVIQKEFEVDKLTKKINEDLVKLYNIHHTSLQIVYGNCC